MHCLNISGVWKRFFSKNLICNIRYKFKMYCGFLPHVGCHMWPVGLLSNEDKCPNASCYLGLAPGYSSYSSFLLESIFIVYMSVGFISQWLEFLLLLPPLLGWSGTELVRTAENFLSTELARYTGCCVLGWVMIGRNFRGRSAWVGVLGSVRNC